MKVRFLTVAAILALCSLVVLAGDEKDPVHPLRIHPLVFSMFGSWISDSEYPVVTEISLDAVEKNGNQFDMDRVKQEEGWTMCRPAEGDGFMRYRVVESKANHYKVEYQENGGGTLTTSAFIGFSVEKRSVVTDGKPKMLRVLRLISYEVR